MKKSEQATPYNLFDDIVKTADIRKTKPALIDGKRSISYSELVEAANFAASAFKAQGVQPFAKCVLIGHDSPEYIFAALGILACRGVFVSAGKEISNCRFNELLARISVDFAVIEESFCKKLVPEGYNKNKSITIGTREFLVFSKQPSSQSGLSSEEDFRKINPAFIRFTSGTTGDSKGVVLAHQTIKERTEGANSALQITENDCVLWLLPMAYHFAVTIMLFLRKGCAINIAIDDPTATIIAKLLDGKTTFVYATPYHYGNMVSESEKTGKIVKIPDTVRLLISTAMPLTADLFAKFAKKFNRYLNQAYGIIECGLPCVNTTPTAGNGLSVGRHLPGYQLRLAIKEQDDYAGEIVIKGPGFFDAYFDPWVKSDRIMSKGWFYTGDMGHFDPDGTLKIVGRQKSVINFLGLKIFPEQVEQVLLQHPGIAEARVFGEEHPDYGQIVIAEIITENGVELDDIELTRFCAGTLPQQEIPQEFRKVASIVKTGSGKTKR